MKSILINFVIILIFFFIPSNNNAQTTPNQKSAIEHIKQNLEYIASDNAEGRRIGTRGETVASNYIAGKLDEYGVAPFGDEGTFFQRFRIKVNQYQPQSKVTIFYDNGISEDFRIQDDIYISGEHIPSEKYNYHKYDLVFAGYGITAPEYNYDDYKGLDVKGKVVLILSGAPSGDAEKHFSPEDEATLSDRKYKYENAKDHHASGLLVIPMGGLLHYLPMLKKSALSSSEKLFEDEGNNPDDDEFPMVYLYEESLKHLLSKEEYTYDGILEAVNENQIPAVFNLSSKIMFECDYTSSVKEARNVIGIIEGTDEKLKNEYVVLSAHYDHEGIINGEIYNGADDDGSGTVAILEAARRIAPDRNNKRSVLITFHTGEEEGLFGSQYLTSHSKYIKDVVADINIDMVGRGSTDSIYSIGSNKLSTELHDLVEKTNDETVKFCFNYEFDSPADPNRYYYRSDHYNYAKHNIPIVFFYDHMTEDYHKPTDDVDKINFKKIEKISTLITELSHRIANLDHRLIIDKTDQ